MKAGFTGTQKGMTRKQRVLIAAAVFSQLDITELHHGDCIGADSEIHETVRGRIRTVIHPPVDTYKRAWCVADETREEKPYLERNRDIVDETELLLAAPSSMRELLRSGTWATIRYAIKSGHPTFIVYPDGSVRFENGE